jgi:hypothetical protein
MQQTHHHQLGWSPQSHSFPMIPSVPFYMYDDDVIKMATFLKCRGKNSTQPDEDLTDVVFITMMAAHPWRVQDPEKAKVFIIPTPLETSLLYRGKLEECAGTHLNRTTSAFKRLFDHPVYKKYNASHYLHVHGWGSFAGWMWPRENFFPIKLFTEGNMSNIIMGRYERYFTTAADCDKYGSQFDMCTINSTHRLNRPTTGLYHDHWELSRCAIVVPYAASGGLRKLQPSFEEWDKRNNTVFYQGGGGAYAWGGTRIRKAPLNKTFASLPGVKVGTGLPPKEWVAGFENTKFCLVMRGDTPSSHSLYNSMKSGCMPVIVSDTLFLFGLPFTSQLPWSLFTITFPEEVFVMDSLAVARVLWQYPQKHLRTLFANMQAFQNALLYETNNTLLGDYILRQVAVECL